MAKIPESELIINPDGSIFHLKLHPEDIGNIILLVGDQGRVEMVSKYFDKVDVKKQNREFVTHTGKFNGKTISAISTGIGTDNLDIVVNELDALVNIDLQKREVKSNLSSLNLVRIGTSGALQEHIPVDSYVLSEYGLGMDGLLNFYDASSNYEKEITTAFLKQTGWAAPLNTPYLIKGSETLFARLKKDCFSGITATACGFYGPQGRELRLKPAINGLNEKLTAFDYNGLKITNFEMETSALFGLSKCLGHQAATVCAIIANRILKQFSKDYKKTVDKLIEKTLQDLTS
jgi:uridine phosphorylase